MFYFINKNTGLFHTDGVIVVKVVLGSKGPRYAEIDTVEFKKRNKMSREYYYESSFRQMLNIPNKTKIKVGDYFPNA